MKHVNLYLPCFPVHLPGLKKSGLIKLTAEDIEQIIRWLEELWLTDDEVRKVISADEWLDFMEAVIEAAKQLIYN